MPAIRPFRAIRYNLPPGGDLTELIAPPYDVLGEADKRALLDRNPHNIVAIDLPHTPPKSLGPAEAYQRSADLLNKWLSEKVLVADAAPAVYAYQQNFADAAGRHVRRGFLAAVAAEPFAASPAGIFPHEQTFGGPKADRLALTRATRCQLSPIFGLFADEGNAIIDGLYADLAGPPDLRGHIGDVLHEAWRIDDAGRIDSLAAAMAPRPIFIADGHHRYTTALNYLAELEREGPVRPDHPARSVLFVCVSLNDPHLVIWPTHRVLTIKRFDLESLFSGDLKGSTSLSRFFDITPTEASIEQLEARVAAAGAGTFAVKSSAGPQGWILRLTDPSVMDRLEPGRSAAYRRLDVAILHRVLIDEAIKPRTGEPLAVEYPHTAADVSAALARRDVSGAASFGTGEKTVSDTVSGAGGPVKLAFILAPTPLAAVRQVCLAGELMPQKSTFFYPKLATGLALHRL